MPQTEQRPLRRAPVVALPARRRSSVRPRAAARGLLVAAVVTLGSLLWAPPASAHDELLDLQPGNKVVVSTPPTQVQLVFGAPALKVGTLIRVTDPRGVVVSTGSVAIDGGSVVQQVRSGLVDGVYRVDWRVTAADGHPVTGMYTFTLNASAAPTTPSGSASTGVASSTASSPPTTVGAPSASGGSNGSASSTSSGSGPATGLVVGLSALVAAAAGTAFVLVRRRNGASISNEGNQLK